MRVTPWRLGIAENLCDRGTLVAASSVSAPSRTIGPTRALCSGHITLTGDRDASLNTRFTKKKRIGFAAGLANDATCAIFELRCFCEWRLCWVGSEIVQSHAHPQPWQVTSHGALRIHCTTRMLLCTSDRHHVGLGPCEKVGLWPCEKVGERPLPCDGGYTRQPTPEHACRPRDHEWVLYLLLCVIRRSWRTGVGS